jgi:hypothetical protein
LKEKEEKQYGEYRTRRLVREISYREMQQSDIINQKIDLEVRDEGL